MRFIWIFWLFTVGCGTQKKSTSISPNTQISENSETDFQQGISVALASNKQCTNGGSVITVYEDKNNNLTLDKEERKLNTTLLCNGISGSNGEDGRDGLNGQNGANGIDGADGKDGADGRDGMNGQNGADGKDALFYTGPVGPMIPNSQILSACHHDYLLIPNSENPSRSWLLFRHQANGLEDEGIGNSGFQVWNADISDFLLSSELRNKDYCQMHWDPTSLTLSYTVLTNEDGLGGTQGELHF